MPRTEAWGRALVTNSNTSRSARDVAFEPLWSPSPAEIEASEITRFQRWVTARTGVEFADYLALWRWSVTHVSEFWQMVSDYFGVIGDPGPGPALTSPTGVLGARWFEGAELNWAENIVARLPSGTAVITDSQTRPRTVLSSEALVAQVSRAQAGLRDLGVRRGDRVAAYLPNVAEAVILLLACASLGAIFTSCPPEFGVKAVVDRLSQVEPVVLVAVDGYRHKDRAIDRLHELQAIREHLPTLQHVVLLPYLDQRPQIPPGCLTWADFLGPVGPLEFDRVPFDHPLYILYSSGTTGPPKAIVHGHGGILLEHMKLHHLQHGLRAGDRFFWYSTTGWVMWNYLVSGLLAGVTLVLFDGDPGYPDLDTLWALAEREQITVFGVSASFLAACMAAGLHPNREHDLSAIRQVGSTGAYLPGAAYSWVYDEIGKDLMLVSASGGTDVATAFCAGAPNVAVYAGEISCPCLGVKVESFDDDGSPVIGVQGELVVTAAMPSMPVRLWGDETGERYRQAYFERFPGAWAHGDLLIISDRYTLKITGRSDATLNRGGVRIGTSDFYSVMDALDQVTDSLVVHLESDDGSPGELLLFVIPADGTATITAQLRNTINAALHTLLSPRHVPDRIIAVQTVPRTLSGKRIEVPIKRILQGAQPDTVLSTETLADPGAIDAFVAFAASQATLNTLNPRTQLDDGSCST